MAGATIGPGLGTVRGPLTRLDTEALAGRAQATVADPLPLGLAGFASAPFTISSIYAGWFKFTPADLSIAIPVALVFGGIAQFLAGMWAFRRGNMLAATAFGSFGAFNTAWALLQWLMLIRVLPGIAGGGDPAYVAGIFVLTFSLIALYLGVAALGDSLAIAAILFTLSLTYLFDGVAAIVPQQTWLAIVGGYCGIVSSSLAFLISAAILINSSLRREAIPLFAAPSANSR